MPVLQAEFRDIEGLRFKCFRRHQPFPASSLKVRDRTVIAIDLSTLANSEGGSDAIELGGGLYCLFVDVG
jgi:hypothetical protein